jgi:TM2 domain-containing membrane protein YozV
LIYPSGHFMDPEYIMFCPRCGSDNPRIAKYCNNCGFALHEIQSLLQKREDPEETPETQITGPVTTSVEPVVPVKKEDPKKQYIRTTSMLPEGPEEAFRKDPVPIRPDPEPEKITNPVSVQASPSLHSGAVQQPTPATVPARIRNPSLAAALSLLPGLGQVYNGMLVRAIILFIATLLGLFIFIIPGVCIWIYSIYDAFRTAEKINCGETAFGPQKK